MVSAQPAVLPSAVPPSPRRPACGCPTCCTPPTATPTTCSPAATTTCCRPAACPRGDRWYTRLHGDDELDIWLISWVPDHSTELHDHGGSLGALTVVSGALRETRGTARRCGAVASERAIRRRSRWAGCTTSCGRPTGPVGSGPRRPTLSVHAYSPPLTAMSYYEVTERNTLRRKRTELTDAPEGRVDAQPYRRSAR